MKQKLVFVALGAMLSAGLAVAPPTLAGGKGKADDVVPESGVHNLDGPLSKKQREQKTKALKTAISGKEQAGSKVAKVATGEYVELAREKTERVFVIIAEFGNTRHPDFADGGSNAVKFEGPLHNEIPQPDRRADNSTLWQPDYNKAHYENMYFTRMSAYFQRQSSGRYSIQGRVADWVKVPFNEARYGRNVCGGIVCNNTWQLIRDSMAIWTKQQLESGQTMAQIQAYLAEFDIWDRYDFDKDGNFDEKDGYIDHFQIVHAGGDEASGDPLYGTDAIWSHRWYAQLSPFGSTGPAGGGQFGGVNAGSGGLSGGVDIPDNPTGTWVGDYTIQPENGGLGVFVHEYMHDLGLPDLYDTSGNTGGAENSTGFWSLMSSGANIGNGGPDGIGDSPTDLLTWEKLQVGWLGCDTCPGGKFYDIATAGQKSNHKLGPNDAATKRAQAVIVNLPDKQVTTTIGPPFAGANFYYSGSGDDLDQFMTKTVSVPPAAKLTAQVRYEIEEGFDYAYLVSRPVGGTDWTPIATSVSAPDDPNGQNLGSGITGSTDDAWVALTADLAALGGTTAEIGFRYRTDGAAAEIGISIDDIAIAGEPVDGAEAASTFTLTGFKASTGTEVTNYLNAYFVENRQYDNYDASLRTAYNFGNLSTKPDTVETFPYQDGMLITYWDSSQSDNNVGEHPGEGLLLPVDAHPTFHHYADGQLVRPRILTYDSTFTLESTDAITVNKNGQPTLIPSEAAVSRFDDRNDYWFATDSDGHVGRFQPNWVGVKVPKTGTRVTLRSVNRRGTMQVRVDVARKRRNDGKQAPDAAESAEPPEPVGESD
jgi:immune inhibitor A